MTTYNVGDVIAECLESIISRIDKSNFEIIVVDNESNDSTWAILEESARHFPMKLIRARCSRGVGWQTAYEHSHGEIIIIVAGDTIYNDAWREAVRIYESKKFDFALSMWFSEIFPRKILNEVGGWRDLQYWEDVELRARLARVGKLKRYPLRCGTNLRRLPSRDFIQQTGRRVRKFHDKMLIAWFIPLYVWLWGVWGRMRKAMSVKSAMIYFPYYAILLIAAWTMSRFHGFFQEYGDTRYLTPNLLIDLGLSSDLEDMSGEFRYLTREECIIALRNGDFSFIPDLYD
jgi:glycosyltransferase involved in cell wall biosynthesis